MRTNSEGHFLQDVVWGLLNNTETLDIFGYTWTMFGYTWIHTQRELDYMIDKYERWSVLLFIFRLYKSKTCLFVKSSSVNSGDCGLALASFSIQRGFTRLCNNLSRARTFTGATGTDGGRWNIEATLSF